MNFIRQFWIFDLNTGVADLLGAGAGTKAQRRAAIFGQRVSGMTSRLIFAYQPARPKKLFFWGGDTLQWDTSQYHPKLLVSIFQVTSNQGLDIKNVELKMLGLGGALHVFRPFLRQDHEKWDNENEKNEIMRPKNEIEREILAWHFCTYIQQAMFLHIFLTLENTEIFLDFFCHHFLYMLPAFRNFQN